VSASGSLLSLLAAIPFVATLLLGVQIRVAYLSEVVRNPRPLCVGLAGQLLLLPLLATAFFYVYPAPAAIGVGWWVLAAVPGGAFSNTFTFIGRGRLPLSVVLTACSTLAGVVTIPTWVAVAGSLAGDGMARSLPVSRMVAGSFAILVVPLVIGIAIGTLRPSLAARLEKPTRRLLVVFIVIGGVVWTAQRWEQIAPDFSLAALLGAASFHAAAFLGGWSAARGFGLGRPDAFTIGIEVGVQNVVVALLILEVMGRGDLVPVIGYYMMATVLMAFVWVMLFGSRAEGVEAAAPEALGSA
jgi:BASS family bile acid:Na+ symporter